MVDALRSVFFIQVQDTFRICIGFELMAAAEEILTQLQIVINLAIKNNPYRIILVAQRLRAFSNVNDGQPAEAQADPVADPQLRIVRSPVMDQIHHAANEMFGWLLIMKMIDSGNATHRFQILSIIAYVHA